MLLILLAIFVFVPVVLFFALRWLARRWLLNRPAHPYAAKITASGFVLYALLTVLLLYVCIKYQLEPDSALGALLHKPGGVVIGLVMVMLVVGYVERYLRKIGGLRYWVARERESGSMTKLWTGWRTSAHQDK